MERRPVQSRQVLRNDLRFQPLQPRPQRPQVPVGIVRFRSSQESLLAELGEGGRVGALVAVQVPEDLSDPDRLQLRKDAVEVRGLLLPEVKLLQRTRMEWCPLLLLPLLLLGLLLLLPVD